VKQKGREEMKTYNDDRLKADEYATAQDFCKIFTEEVQSLYLLALMLTGDHDRAEQCFVAALSDCQYGRDVFKEWAASRSRLAVIERAILMMGPSEDADEEERGEVPAGLSNQLTPILRLDAFHRFVFVLTNLEQYSARDCAILLRRRIPEIQAARLQAMKMIAGEDGKHRRKDDREIVAPPVHLLSTAISA
jgi:hypothetical protein